MTTPSPLRLHRSLLCLRLAAHPTGSRSLDALFLIVGLLDQNSALTTNDTASTGARSFPSSLPLHFVLDDQSLVQKPLPCPLKSKVAECLLTARARGHRFSRSTLCCNRTVALLTRWSVYCLVQRRPVLTYSTCFHPLISISGRILRILDRKHFSIHRTNARARPSTTCSTCSEMAAQHPQTAILLTVREAGVGEETTQPIPGRALFRPLG